MAVAAAPARSEHSLRDAHPILDLVGRRVVIGVVTLSVVSLVVFLATQVLPGNAAFAVLGRSANPSRLRAVERQPHLNRGLLDQYWVWLSGLLAGKLGVSLANGQSVWALVKPPRPARGRAGGLRAAHSRRGAASVPTHAGPSSRPRRSSTTGSYGAFAPLRSGPPRHASQPPPACGRPTGRSLPCRCARYRPATWTGEITFDGTRLTPGVRDRPKQVLRRIQYVFQNPYTSLNPRKTVGQIVAQPLEQFFGLTFAERSERVVGVREDVSLGGDFLSRYPDQLSGGERQRVAIARALAVEPDLLACDEVTSALDVSVQAVIVEELRRLQRERHLAMIFITHNLALVRTIAQSAVVLRNGAVVESGPVEQVLGHPADPYTVRLMADVPELAVP